MTDAIVARRYAGAIFALGKQQGDEALSRYGSDLAALGDMLAASPKLDAALKSPVISIDEKKAVMGKLLKKIKADKTVSNFCLLLADKERLAYLGEIVGWYGKLLDDAKGIIRGTLTTAVELTDNKRAELKAELEKMMRDDRPKYETFWKNFGRQVKFGVYGDYGMHKDLLGDLLMFYSAKEQKLVTLDEYIEKMPEGQKCIYFAAGDDTDRLGKLPNAQLVLSKGYDLLLCTEDVDEFCLQVMHDYKEKEFQNINTGDLGLETEDEKKAAEAAETENKDLFEEIKKDLNGKIKEVKVNPTLQEHPVTLSSAEGGISMEMEKVLRRMPNAEGVESTKVLELNPNHTVFAALKAAHAAGDTDKVAKYAELLYDQALLIAGLPIEDPVAYAQLVCGLMQ